MKLYKYYLHRRDIPDCLDNYTRGNLNDVILYAYTTDPELAEWFESVRDMKKFIKRVSKGHSKIDIKQLNEEFSTCKLVTYNFMYFTMPYSQDLDENTKYTDLVITTEEKIIIDSAKEGNYILDISGNVVTPIIYQDKYWKALKDLQYISLYKLHLSEIDSRFFGSIASMINERDGVDYDVPKLECDEISVFLKYFGSLFK